MTVQTIPFFHSYHPDTKRLTLRGAKYFPLEILQFVDDIEILDLSGGTLTDLPTELSQLTHLRVLFLSRNPFTTVPQVLRNCVSLKMLGMKSCQLNAVPEDALPANLEWLVFTDNQLSALPESIGELTQLRKLSLAGNRLTDLPASLQQCQQLELIRLGANQLKRIPNWIAALHNLAWYGDASNPAATPFTFTPSVEIPWNDLDIGALVGGSPTSQVYQAEWKSQHKTVAVKLYHGGLTSDGQSDDDRRAHVAAGTHPHIIPLVGQVVGEPTGKLGVVLEWLSSDYQPLAFPPSLTSCTRDVYPDGKQFTQGWVNQVLRDIRGALEHLHRQHITHGDLYGHNILVNAAGDAKLGDFGAASSYTKADAVWRERIDWRAFEILEQELRALQQ